MFLDYEQHEIRNFNLKFSLTIDLSPSMTIQGHNGDVHNEYDDLVYEKEQMAYNQIPPPQIHDIPLVQSQKENFERNTRQRKD